MHNHAMNIRDAAPPASAPCERRKDGNLLLSILLFYELLEVFDFHRMERSYSPTPNDYIQYDFVLKGKVTLPFSPKMFDVSE